VTQVTVTAVGGETVASPVNDARLMIVVPAGTVERTRAVTWTLSAAPAGTEPSRHTTSPVVALCVPPSEADTNRSSAGSSSVIRARSDAAGPAFWYVIS
jgi:hypothetical protein